MGFLYFLLWVEHIHQVRGRTPEHLQTFPSKSGFSLQGRWGDGEKPKKAHAAPMILSLSHQPDTLPLLLWGGAKREINTSWREDIILWVLRNSGRGRKYFSPRIHGPWGQVGKKHSLPPFLCTQLVQDRPCSCSFQMRSKFNVNHFT